MYIVYTKLFCDLTKINLPCGMSGSKNPIKDEDLDQVIGFALERFLILCQDSRF